MELVHLIMEHWFLAILFIAAIPFVINLIVLLMTLVFISVVGIIATVITIILSINKKIKGEIK